MSDDNASNRDFQRATFVVAVGGRTLELQFDVPAGPTRPIELLPLFQSLTDGFVRIAIEQTEAGNEAISCRKGCGACCRQLVPISEVEAESIRALVDALPEPRKQVVLGRFDEACRRLDDAGLLQTLRAPERVSRDDVTAFGMAYFEQAIACPFLEDESCSIHPDRPLSCREYLVTTPAPNCAKPSSESIRCVTVHAKMSRAVRHLDDENPRSCQSWIPLILALEWPRRVEEDAQRRTGTALVNKAFEYLSGRELPEAQS